jgi:hypothetical protein
MILLSALYELFIFSSFIFERKKTTYRKIWTLQIEIMSSEFTYSVMFLIKHKAKKEIHSRIKLTREWNNKVLLCIIEKEA